MGPYKKYRRKDASERLAQVEDYLVEQTEGEGK